MRFLQNLLPEELDFFGVFTPFSFYLSSNDIVGSYLRHLPLDTAGILHFEVPRAIELDVRS